MPVRLALPGILLSRSLSRAQVRHILLSLSLPFLTVFIALLVRSVIITSAIDLAFLPGSRILHFPMPRLVTI